MDEKKIVEPIIRNFPAFARWYKVERPLIPGKIKFIKNPHLYSIALAVIRRRFNGSIERSISFRDYPTEVDALVLAHEYRHFIVDLGGFPIIMAKIELDRSISLATCLNTMLADILANDGLIPYFDISPLYRDSLQKGSLGPEFEPGSVEWLFCVMQYAQTRLQLQAVRDSVNHRDFVWWFGREWRTVAINGNIVYEKANSIGYDTPSKQIAFYRWFIDAYGLDQTLEIKTP